MGESVGRQKADAEQNQGGGKQGGLYHRFGLVIYPKTKRGDQKGIELGVNERGGGASVNKETTEIEPVSNWGKGV